MLFVFLIVCCVCAAYTIWRIKRRRLLQLAALTPTLRGCLPVVGNALALYGDSQHLWDTFKGVMNEATQAGGVLAVWVGPSLHYMITDPDDAVTIVNKFLGKTTYIYGMAANFLGSSLINADVSKWKRNRKLFNPSFSQQMLDQFHSVFNEEAKNLLEILKPLAGKEITIWPLMSDVTLTTMCTTVLGLSKSNEAVVDRKYKDAHKSMFSILAKRFANVFLHPDVVFNLSSLKTQEHNIVRIVHGQSAKAVTQRRYERDIECRSTIAEESKGYRIRPFLDLLLDLGENDNVFKDCEIREELNGIISAGFDTVATATSYTLMLIGSFPEVQEKLYNEIMTVVGADEDVNKHHVLPYLEAVLKESLRLYPPVPVISRYCDEEVQLKNFTLPAGSHCAVGIWEIQRLPVWGSDADQFRPDRWLEPDSLPKNPGVYCSFSLGKRNCLGKHYGMLFIKTVISHIIRRFRIRGDISQVKLKIEVLLKPTPEDHLFLELR